LVLAICSPPIVAQESGKAIWQIVETREGNVLRDSSRAFISQVQKELVNGEFTIFSSTDLIPELVRKDKHIAEPCEPFNSSDAIIPGLPIVRMLNSGASERLAYLFYERGGFAGVRIKLLVALRDTSERCQFNITRGFYRDYFSTSGEDPDPTRTLAESIVMRLLQGSKCNLEKSNVEKNDTFVRGFENGQLILETCEVRK